MRRTFLALIAGVVLLPMKIALAEGEIKPVLMLDNMKVIKAQERDGDELYFSLSVYRPGKETEYLRRPEKPIEWPSQFISKIKMFPLWSEPLQEGEAITIVASLIDSDNSNLNPDDLIGSIRIKLKNEKGTLQTQWVVPNTKEKPITTTDQTAMMHNFVLKDDGGDYEVFLSLESK